MKLYKLSLAAILISIVTAFTSAQDSPEEYNPEDYNRIETTTRVSEFGRIGEVERRKHLDNFLIELQNNPGSTGYIIFYQGKDALPSEYGVKGEQLYLPHIKFKNYDESGVIFVDAFRERQTTEFWIVPAGGKIPGPTATVAPLEVPKADTFLFHRSHFEITAEDFLLPNAREQHELIKEEYARDNGDFINAEEDSTPMVMEKRPEETNVEAFSRASYQFAEKFKAGREDRGVVIFYADDSMFDVKKLADDMRNRMAGMAAEAGVPPGKFEVVFGGYRRGIEIEMWIVPKSQKGPLAKPAQRGSNIAD